jgi:hypothetical protein
MVVLLEFSIKQLLLLFFNNSLILFFSSVKSEDLTRYASGDRLKDKIPDSVLHKLICTVVNNR